jgi:hypothetical protein
MNDGERCNVKEKEVSQDLIFSFIIHPSAFIFPP